MGPMGLKKFEDRILRLRLRMTRERQNSSATPQNDAGKIGSFANAQDDGKRLRMAGPERSEEPFAPPRILAGLPQQLQGQL